MPQSLNDIRHAYDLASEAYAETRIDELCHKPRDVELLQQSQGKTSVLRRDALRLGLSARWRGREDGMMVMRPSTAASLARFIGR